MRRTFPPTLQPAPATRTPIIGARESALRRLCRGDAGARTGERGGEEGLSDTDRKYLAFGTSFEQKQAKQEAARALEEGMAIGWQLPRARGAAAFLCGTPIASRS